MINYNLTSSVSFPYTPVCMANLFLFTGENEWSLRQEVRRWTKEFREKHGEENLERVEAKDATVSLLSDKLATAPFIAERRLVMLEGIPFAAKNAETMEKKDDAKASLAAVLACQHPSVILLIIAPSPDKRLSVTKELLKIATVQEFPALKGEKLHHWVRDQIRLHGSTIDMPALMLLLDFVGDDQMALSNEIEKLALYCTGRSVTVSDVESLVLPSAERNIWALTALLSDGHPEAAVRFVRELLDRGESAQKLWNATILWMIGNLLPVAAAYAEGVRSPEAIADAMGIKPGTARALLPLARRCDRAVLRNVVDRTVQMDLGLKTGSFRTTADSEEELESIIDRSLLLVGAAMTKN